jgi:hypothetical protein
MYGATSLVVLNRLRQDSAEFIERPDLRILGFQLPLERILPLVSQANPKVKRF